MRKRRRNRSEKKLNINPKYVFAVLTVLCAALIFCSYRFSEQFAPVKSAVGNLVTPMQKGIDTVGSKISSAFKRFSDINMLIESNEALTAELNELKNENQLLIREKYELNWYRDLYELDKQYPEYEKVAAKVISREPNSYCNIFIIDKGSEDGILKDMNVLSGNGLVGIVTETGRNWSKVRAIIDDSSSVSGMFIKTSDTCVINGNMEMMDNGYINVEMISGNAQVYENYEVVTSYISNKYLPGILIGYVSNIRVDSSTMTKSADLTPIVDFEHLEAVLVIKELREQYEDLEEVLSSDN